MKGTPFDLTGQVAVITGSSRGIGRSSAELLAQLGAKVVISSRKADAAARAGDDGDLAGEIEWGSFHSVCSLLLFAFSPSSRHARA